jgi:hypothetical protein
MGARGPKLTCECGACLKCRRRASSARWREKSGYRGAKSTERVRAWREQNRERDNANMRAYYHGLDAEGKKRWYARNALNRAIRKGDLERGACEVCAEPNAHGHHDDYDKPLDVRWLCPAHHAETHREVA